MFEELDSDEDFERYYKFHKEKLQARGQECDREIAKLAYLYLSIQN